MPFNSHLLFPLTPDYTPQPSQVLAFLERLIEVGPSRQPEIRLRLPTTEVIYVQNARTGERIGTGMKRMVDCPANTLAEAEKHLFGVDQYVLTVKNSRMVSGVFFDLRRRDGSEVDHSMTCEMAVTCVVRDRRTQFSEPWHEHLRVFLLPQEMRAHACPRCGALHEPESEVQPRFWIQFAFRGAYLPSFKETSK